MLTPPSERSLLYEAILHAVLCVCKTICTCICTFRREVTAGERTVTAAASLDLPNSRDRERQHAPDAGQPRRSVTERESAHLTTPPRRNDAAAGPDPDV